VFFLIFVISFFKSDYSIVARVSSRPPNSSKFAEILKFDEKVLIPKTYCSA